MRSVKIAITIKEDLLTRLDLLVAESQFPNRSQAVQKAVRDKLGRMKRGGLACECAKLNPVFEKSLADEGTKQEK